MARAEQQSIEMFAMSMRRRDIVARAFTKPPAVRHRLPRPTTTASASHTPYAHAVLQMPQRQPAFCHFAHYEYSARRQTAPCYPSGTARVYAKSRGAEGECHTDIRLEAAAISARRRTQSPRVRKDTQNASFFELSFAYDIIAARLPMSAITMPMARLYACHATPAVVDRLWFEGREYYAGYVIVCR